MLIMVMNAFKPRYAACLLTVLGLAALLQSCGGRPLINEYGELRQDLVTAALSQQGIPYRFGGSTPRGFDCSGLVQYSFARIGLSIPRNSYEQYRQSQPVYISHLQPGDLLFFRTDSVFVSHVGMYIGDQLFVHAPGQGKTVTTERLDSDYWQRRLVGAGSFILPTRLKKAQAER